MIFKSASPLPVLSFHGSPRDGLPVIDTNTLREAALIASWQRDQRVGQRRLAMRWVMWWIWKYRYYLILLLTLLLAAAYLLRQQSSPLAPMPVNANPVPAVPLKDGPGIQLRLDPQLVQRGTSPAPNSSLVEEALPPYPLKLDTQLTKKESPP